MDPTCLHWSSGKDAALALYLLDKEEKGSVTSLVTTLVEGTQRISVHGTHERLLDLQALSIGLPLLKTWIPENASMERYNTEMAKTYKVLYGKGVRKAAFGDIFLEDLRSYREKQLHQYGMEAVFPLWKMETKKLIERFIELGFKAVVTCINTKVLDKSFLGRTLDANFLKDLPAHVDACGENGEYHTFVYDGPFFKFPVAFDIGSTTHKEYSSTASANKWDTQFAFCELLPQ